MADLDTSMLGVVAGTALAAAGIYKVIDALAELTIAQAKRVDDLNTQAIVTGIDAENAART
jgi:hypothetical protein